MRAGLERFSFALVQAFYSKANSTVHLFHLFYRMVVFYFGLQAGDLLHMGDGYLRSFDGVYAKREKGLRQASHLTHLAAILSKRVSLFFLLLEYLCDLFFSI